MSSVNKWILSVCFSVVIVLSQVIITQWTWISHLKQQMDLVNQAKKIEGDMIQDLMMQLSNAKSENLTIGSQQFIAGVMAATKNPDRYNEIWHAGYDQGIDVQRYAASAEKESSYTGAE